MRRLVAAMARHYDVPPRLALAIAWQESGWQQRRVSSAGALGVMQVMPDTGRWMRWYAGRPLRLRDTHDNVRAGVLTLRILRSWTKYDNNAIAAYYQGLGAVRRHGHFKDTKRYVASVRAHQRRLQPHRQPELTRPTRHRRGGCLGCRHAPGVQLPALPGHPPRHLALLAITASWGSTFFLIHDLLDRVPVLDFLAVRFTIASVAILLVSPRAVRRLSRDRLRHAIVLGALYGVAQILQTAGLAHHRRPASRASSPGCTSWPRRCSPRCCSATGSAG